MIKLVCWNTAYRRRSWCCLRDMDVDVALVQEACNPPQDVLSAVDTGPREHWDPTTWNSDWWVGRWRHLTDRKTMIVKRSDTVQVEWFKQVAPISCVAKDEIGVSGIGTIAAAGVFAGAVRRQRPHRPLGAHRETPLVAADGDSDDVLEHILHRKQQRTVDVRAGERAETLAEQEQPER